MISGQNFKVDAGCVISSPVSDFEVEAVLGSGCFGEVAQCRKRATGETVALKVLKRANCMKEAEDEVTILTMLRELHCDKFNIVRWIDSFSYQGRFCLEFEKLDISLDEFLRQKSRRHLMEIRVIVQQVATALEFLAGAGIVHADLKPGNIMMVDHVHQPLKVKVIDFGLATYKPAECTGRTLQTLRYRSPEVLMGAPISEAIDIWSLGCIAAKMWMGSHLFPGLDRRGVIRQIVHVLGTPPHHLLSIGQYSSRYFSVSFTEEGEPTWSLRPPRAGREESSNPSVDCLTDLMKMEIEASGASSAEDEEVSRCELAAFVQLLTEMMKMDPAERIPASQILEHPFITMMHLRPTVLEPVDQEPGVQEPVDQEPGVQEPVYQEPVDQEPVDQEPTVQEPGVQELVDQELGVQEPTVQEPVDQEPTIQEPVDQEPTVQEPLVQEPMVQEPVVLEPGVQVSRHKRRRIASCYSERDHRSPESPPVPKKRRSEDPAPLGTDGKTSSRSPGPDP